MLGACAHKATGTTTTTSTASVASLAGSRLAPAAKAADSNVVTNVSKFEASLTDAAGSTATAKVEFRAATVNGVQQSSLSVCVRGATASTTYDVAVNGTVIGTVTTDANGNARALFNSAPATGTASAAKAAAIRHRICR